MLRLIVPCTARLASILILVAMITPAWHVFRYDDYKLLREEGLIYDCFYGNTTEDFENESWLHSIEGCYLRHLLDIQSWFPFINQNSIEADLHVLLLLILSEVCSLAVAWKNKTNSKTRKDHVLLSFAFVAVLSSTSATVLFLHNARKAVTANSPLIGVHQSIGYSFWVLVFANFVHWTMLLTQLMYVIRGRDPSSE
ncbi:hypothetical protein M514_08011 [Trichuris suis]|uniref:Uncharacterized protein n=1 Tax=Trichuris suis TaxID=68888 RepID=A0A085N0T4_9BILA|nr:hypothetical protein M513_08011 [Trichuris suis]KFD63080.1 hypothetical protein M514_08011 [Trichuris suis]